MNLQEKARDAGISYAHVVDDAFDKVPGAELRPESVQTFLSSLSEPLFDELARILGRPEGTEDELIGLLGNIEGTVRLFGNRHVFGQPAVQLFEEFTVGQTSEKERVTLLVDYLKGIGIDCQTFGRNYNPVSEPEPEMIFIDLKLNEREIRIEEPIGVVKALKKQYPNANPLVFLMSSVHGVLQGHQENFRDKCELLTTQFEILPKKLFDNYDDLRLFLDHHITVYPQLRKLHAHVLGWGKALDNAKQNLQRTLRRLDLADYFVLYNNTIYLEEIPLGTYISDLLLEYVAHEIEASPSVWEFAKDLDEWELRKVTRSRFNIEPVVGDVFSANILHAFPRIAAESDRKRGPNSGYLNLGDVFFLSEEVKSNKIKTSYVVLTPACDLVRPEMLRKRKASIFLCEGEVDLLKPGTILKEKELDGLHPVILRYPYDGEQQFVITWHKKRLQTWKSDDVDALTDVSSTKFIHVGRLRPLCSLQLQNVITSDLSRVGLQRPPDAYVPCGVEVLVADNDKWKLILQEFRDEPSAGAVLQNKSAKKITFILSDVLVRNTVRELREWAKNNSGKASADLLARLTKCNEVDGALMYHIHNIDIGEYEKRGGEKSSEIVLPLRGKLPEETAKDIITSVVFAIQDRADDNKYGGGKQRVEGTQEVLVFRFVKVKK